MPIPRFEKINLAQFVALKAAGRSVVPRVIGYNEGRKKVRSVAMGTVLAGLPPVRKGISELKDMRPAKQARNFSERYFSGQQHR